MIIDARELGGSNRSFDFLSSVTDRDAEMLRRMVDRKVLPPPTDE